MSEKIYFVRCSDDCLAESMTKEQIFAAIAEATGNTPTGVDEAFITKIKEGNENGAVSFWVGTEAQFNALGIETALMYIRVDDNKRVYLTPNDFLGELANRGYVPMERGGTGATSGAEGLTNLLAAGPMILSANQYGEEFPANPVPGQIFFVPMDSVPAAMSTWEGGSY